MVWEWVYPGPVRTGGKCVHAGLSMLASDGVGPGNFYILWGRFAIHSREGLAALSWL